MLAILFLVMNNAYFLYCKFVTVFWAVSYANSYRYRVASLMISVQELTPFCLISC